MCKSFLTSSSLKTLDLAVSARPGLRSQSNDRVLMVTTRTGARDGCLLRLRVTGFTLGRHC
eukprot:2545461-Amphidinium_carterae.1